ncbi:MAG: ABC transporter permease [Rothia sp. (in: high G+C Gram-positive bacteria)]|nr:ABC transporter permease [Rothia sp. (in: high G+C Gram-positive bacteria)]
MNLRESISLALGSLRTNKMRSFLTLLGIIVGIASVITIMTLGHSLKTQASESIVSSGANDLMVNVVPRPTEEQEEAGLTSGPMGMPNGEYIEPAAESKFDEHDIATLKEALGDNIAGIPIGANSYVSVNLSAGESQAPYTNAQFVNMDYLELNPVTLVAGRSLSQADMDAKRPVILLSTDQAHQLFSDPQAAVGNEIDLQFGMTSRSFMVVGVYQTEAIGSGIFAYTGPGSVYLPVSLESDIESYSSNGWNSITVRPAEGKDLGQVKALLQAHLTSMYRTDEHYMAEIQDFSAMTEQFNAVLDGISAAISAIAGISLLVGGIGVMNIMLVTVTERTREIGIRKALGATRGAIRLQFVVEAMMVCLVGGLLGVLIGGGLGMLGASLLGTFVVPPLGAVLLALGFSLAIGLFFGYYPANKAAKLDPIEALRYE